MEMNTQKNGITYQDAGVNREAADRLVAKIGALAQSTKNTKVKASIGGYASIYELDSKRWIAASTDGVGTKLKLAFHLKNHRTIGIDLVAMSVNDLLCVGATPLFFLDYFATGKLDSGVAEQVIEGIVAGCKQAKSALVGGETAEMPDFYQAGEYDLGGFAVGSMSPKELLPRVKSSKGKPAIEPGDVLIGLASSGCHSNGYSLLRKLLERESGPEKESKAKELLTPTRIYVQSLLPLIQKGKFKGLSHITGSGFLNVPRMSEKVSYQISLPDSESLAPIYNWVREKSNLPFSELAQTFNLGIGMVAVVSPKDAKSTVAALNKKGEKAFVIGQVIEKDKGPSTVFINQRVKGSLQEAILA